MQIEHTANLGNRADYAGPRTRDGRGPTATMAIARDGRDGAGAAQSRRIRSVGMRGPADDQRVWARLACARSTPRADAGSLCELGVRAGDRHKVTIEWAGTVDVIEAHRRRRGRRPRHHGAKLARRADPAGRGTWRRAASNVARDGRRGTGRRGPARHLVRRRRQGALLSAQSIAYSSGPSGVYLERLVQRMGIADAIKAKMKQIPPGGAVGERVARGDAEIGFQQVSELSRSRASTSSGRCRRHPGDHRVRRGRARRREEPDARPGAADPDRRRTRRRGDQEHGMEPG